MKAFAKFFVFLLGVSLVSSHAQAELSGKYVTTISFTEGMRSSTSSLNEKYKRKYQHIVAFVGAEVLVSADTLLKGKESYIGEKFRGKGKKCRQNGGTKYCVTYSPRRDGANIVVTLDSKGFSKSTTSYKLTVTPKGCTVTAPSYKAVGYGLIGENMTFTVSGLKATCRKG